ncbi:hypothetical protein AAU61_21135 [Desulfocarbo indianensis]|nr:hypothetical protein AAU61_21135 [Desulfocarbo indianensis]
MTADSSQEADRRALADPRPGLAALRQELARRRAVRGADYRITPAGLWTGSEVDEVFSLFSQLNLAKYPRVADLGSGDGRVACLAGLFTSAVGIEADPWLVNESRDLASRLGLAKVEFKLGDMRSAKLSDYDLLYIFPDKPLDWLEESGMSHWRGRLLVYGPGFQPKKLKHLATIYAGATLCALWSR